MPSCGIFSKASVNDPKRSANEQKIGDDFAACMDEKAIDAKGSPPSSRTSTGSRPLATGGPDERNRTPARYRCERAVRFRLCDRTTRTPARISDRRIRAASVCRTATIT